jgi:hypothetical protein
LDIGKGLANHSHRQLLLVEVPVINLGHYPSIPQNSDTISYIDYFCQLVSDDHNGPTRLSNATQSAE